MPPSVLSAAAMRPSPSTDRLVAHQTAAGLRYQLERWEPSTLSRRGIWKPTGPLLEPRHALHLMQDKAVQIVR